MHSRSIAAVTLLFAAACAGPSEETRPPQAAQETPPPAPPTEQPPQMQGQMQPGMQQPGMQQPGMQGMQDQQMMQPGMQQPGTQPMETQQPAAEMMSDEQFVHIATVINTHFVEEGKLAQQKAKDQRVKRYGTNMVQEMGMARDQEQRIVTRMKMKPQESEKSKQLEMENRQEMDRLRALTGAAFDRQYIQDQVDDHTEFLTMIDTKILPNIKTQELKVHFEGLRPKVAKYLTEAQDLQRQIGTAPVSRR